MYGEVSRFVKSSSLGGTGIAAGDDGKGLRPIRTVPVCRQGSGLLGEDVCGGAGHAFVHQRLFQHLGTHRGRKAAAGGGPAVGFIQADQTQKLRVVDGRHGYKAGNAGFFVGAVQLLAGAAPSAKPSAPAATPKPTQKPTSTPTPEPVEPEPQVDAVQSTWNDISKLDIPSLTDLDDATLTALYGIDPADLDSYLCKMPMVNVQATEFFIAKVKDGKMDTVKAAVEKRQDDLEAQWSQYLPEQLELVQNYKLVTNGNYILFAVSEYADEAVTAFNTYTK